MEPGKPVSIRRCAIYTRKSSEEGLEQDFNSLHAQREACEAFIKSQTGEGWRLIKTAYDDGGLSGGTMERPALKRLLADINSGMVDVVVVYKVDRLTRSLADFAKMVEVFDARGVSFVAVTQNFNTTTSMGRLTLNVLLSFAQFEREVTGERIRDKIAASKRKGLWMGGVPPLGYDVCDRRLVINNSEAATVKLIFERYLKLGSVRLLKNELDRRGIISKVRVSRKGIKSGGRSFSRGALYELLANPIYIGEVRHREERHPGQHPPILERAFWERTQRKLRDRAARAVKSRTKAVPSPLAGKLFDENGQPLYAQGAAKGKRRYRYYVSRDLVRGSADRVRGGWRVAAPEMERAVVVAARNLLNDKAAVLAALNESGIEVSDIRQIFELASDWSRRLVSETEWTVALSEVVERVELTAGGIRVGLKLVLPSGTSETTAEILRVSHFAPISMKRRGVELRLILDGKGDPPRKPDPALL
jgi:site-specific DNA recombinase